MRKILLLIPMLALMVFSCKKTSETAGVKLSQPVAGDNTALINDIKAKSEAFLVAQGKGSAHVLGTGEVLAADAGGAIVGGVAGGWLGALTGGVFASLWVIVHDTTKSITRGGTGIGNSGNPYDYVGYWHYRLLNNCLDTPSLYGPYPYTSLNNAMCYNYATSQLVNNGVATPADVSNYSLPAFSADLSNVTSTLGQGQSFSQFTQSLVANGKLTNDEKAILDPYMTVALTAINLNNFISYSISVEASVNNSTTLSSQSKTLLLTAMSTARWGVCYYWQ